MDLARPWLICCILCGVLLAAPEGWARGPETARKHFNRAETAYKLGRYTEAIREYEAAYRALPKGAFLFNIAQAHRLQYDPDQDPEHLQKALSLYKSYLREVPDAPNRETVNQLIVELKALLKSIQGKNHKGGAPEQETALGTLILRGDATAGAEVKLDGQPLGVLPLSSSVPAGTHQVLIQREGFEAWSSTLKVPAGGRLEIPVKLTPLPAAGSTPFYKTWWFWTALGTAVAAGAGIGIYYGTRDESAVEMPQVDLR